MIYKTPLLIVCLIGASFLASLAMANSNVTITVHEGEQQQLGGWGLHWGAKWDPKFADEIVDMFHEAIH